jgi:4-alpha-glucanotransferase
MVTPAVIALRDKFGFPGMQLAQFSFGGDEKDWPKNWPEDCVGYTGTHDNDTTRGWFEDDGATNTGRPAPQVEKERAAFLRAAGEASDDGPSWAMARLVWHSPARLAIAPMQDLLSLGSQTRMNRPGSMESNWRWRMEPDALTWSVAGRLGAMTSAAGRAPEDA